MAITTATSQQTSNSTTSTISMPASVAAGDMLIGAAAQDSGATSNTWTAGWTELLDSNAATGIICAAAYKIAAGGETSVVATHTTERSNHIGIRIPAAEWANDGTAPVISTIATGSSTTPNPGSLTIPWAATNKTILIALMFADDSASPGPITGWPTGYTGNQVSNTTASSAGVIACAVKPESAATSPEDPAAFTMTGTETWGAVVIAVKGAALAENHDGTLALVGGGVVTLALTKNGIRLNALTGGGVTVQAITAAHTKTLVGTGGGVVSSAITTARSRTNALTGGGPVILQSGKLVLQALVLTGGGVVTTVRQKGAQRAAALATGGGVVALALATARSRANALTASGTFVAAIATARSRANVLTGGGVVTTIRQKGAALAAVLTGGGVATVFQTTARNRANALTGGGVVVLVGESSQGAPGTTLFLTGGGVATIAAAKGGERALIVTGGGTVAAVIQKGGRVAVAMTGGGSVLFSPSGGRTGILAPTGGGLVTPAGSGAHAGGLQATGGGLVTIAYTLTLPTDAEVLAAATIALFDGDEDKAYHYLLARAVDLKLGRAVQMRYVNPRRRRAQADLHASAAHSIRPDSTDDALVEFGKIFDLS